MQKEHDKLWLPTPPAAAQSTYTQWMLKKNKIKFPLICFNKNNNKKNL